MIREFKGQARKYQLLPNFGICCRERGGWGSKILVFEHACAVSALSIVHNHVELDLWMPSIDKEASQHFKSFVSLESNA